MTVRSLDSVHRLRYFRICNVLHIWTIRAIPTYRVYRLYDYEFIARAATIRGLLLFIALALRAATIRGRLLFDVRLLFV